MKKLALLLFPFILVFSLCAKAEKDTESDNAFPSAPEFTLTDLKGSEISLSDYQGKVIFINFWATWCPPCRAEIPGFVEVFDKYKEKGMQVLGISLDRTGKKKVQKFAKEYKINYPVAIATSEIVKDYKPGQYIPSTIIIDRKGKIRHKHIGYLDKKALEKYFLYLERE